MRRRLADRRARPRFEIVGQMPGTVESVFRLAMCNISAEGVLAKSSTPLPLNSVHRVTLRWDNEDVPASVRVRHVRRETDTPRGAYLLGLEFVGVSPELLQQIVACMTAGGPTGEPA